MDPIWAEFGKVAATKIRKADSLRPTTLTKQTIPVLIFKVKLKSITKGQNIQWWSRLKSVVLHSPALLSWAEDGKFPNMVGLTN